MAFPTAIGITFSGISISLGAWREVRYQSKRRSVWLPGIVAICSVTMSLVIWQELYILERQSIKNTVQLEATNVKEHLEIEINSRILMLEQMANRWSMHKGGPPEQEWRLDAARYLRDYPSYQAIEWADSNFVIRLVEPVAGNEAAIDLDLKLLSDHSSTLQYARDDRVTVLTRRQELVQGGSGVIIYTPIYQNDEFQGFIIGVFRTNQLLPTILPQDFGNKYFIRLEVGDETLFRTGGEPNQAQSQFSAAREIESHGAIWTATIYPKNESFESLGTVYDELILLIGLLMSAMLVVAVYYMQEAQHRNLLSVEINENLKSEISKRHETTEELRASEQQNRDIIDKSLGYICTHKLDGTLISINPAAANALGYSPDEMIGKKIPDFMPKSGRRLFSLYLARIPKKFEIAGTFQVLPKESEPRTWEFQNILYEKSGSDSFILAHAVDVTDRNKVEAELKNARNSALESVRIKSEFLANMSHEIRTPMNGILGMTELLADTELDQTQRIYLDTIKAGGDALLELVNDILDFSKIEAGKLRFDKIDFDLRNTIENAVEMFAEQAGAKHIELASLVHSDVEVALRGDPGRLRQVLTNLIGNAVKFTKSGEIIVRVQKELESKKAIVLRFTVSDTGIGISEEAQGFLFDAFTQADGSITRKFGGTGLGLTISKQLVTMMEGEFSVESKAGIGSTFTFTAVFDKQPMENESKVEIQTDFSKFRVLVVDDNFTNRSILTHQLESKGISVSAAESGAEALQMLRAAAKDNKVFNLVLLDLLMPTMSGFKLARLIRGDSQISNTNLILMPSYGRRGHGRIAKKVDINGYLTKPIKQSDLFNCISAVLNLTSAEPDQKKTSSRKLVTRHTIKEEQFKNTEKILLVEDNLVNQKLIQIQLSRLGYRADLASNGIEAVSAIGKKSYDLILMDCQMPEMDGYAATEAIRKSETNGKRLPIIAITANVMKEEVGRCFSSGMDSFLAKPFSQQQLRTEIDRWLHRQNESLVNRVLNSTNEEPTIEPEGENGIFESVNRRIIELERDIGAEIADEIISLFLDDSKLRLKELSRVILANDFAGIKTAAHGLKGSCANIGGKHIANICFEIENASKVKDIETINLLSEKINRLFPVLTKALIKTRDSILENSAVV